MLLPVYVIICALHEVLLYVSYNVFSCRLVYTYLSMSKLRVSFLKPLNYKHFCVNRDYSGIIVNIIREFGASGVC